MKTVGLRELKNNLSAYVRAARRGETVIVTDRGEAVARLVSAEDRPRQEHPLAEMARRGEARLGTKLSPQQRAKVYSWRGPPMLNGNSAEIIDALREDTI